MPGMYGGFCAHRDLRQRFGAAFTSALAGSVEICADTLMLGGHAHRSRSAVSNWTTPGGRLLVAVDGDSALYHAFENFSAAAKRPDLEASWIVETLQSGGTGNVAVLSTDPLSISVQSDWSGSFPLYYAPIPGGVLFSSLVRPMRAALGPTSADMVGIIEFLREGHTYSGRTVFKEIKRLLPGQALHYTPDEGLRIEETSRAWVGYDAALATPGAAAEASWAALRAVATRSVDGEPSGLMMSAGWDSRTLLALEASIRGARLQAYSHGPPKSRELRLTRELCDAAGVPFTAEPIDDRVLGPAMLDAAFRTSETLVFAHWHRSGRFLAERGVVRLSAGVYGEILGGHYGQTMRASSGIGKARALLASLRDHSSEPATPDRSYETAGASFQIGDLGSPWYLAPDVKAELIGDAVAEAVNADVRADLKRLRDRGVATPDQLVEAFISEHRGSHYINAQLLSLRSYVDVSLPFAAREVLEVVTRIPIAAKVHNRVNRAMLQDHWPTGLRSPTAAILVPAGAPLLAQEASRALRKLCESAWWFLHFRMPAVIPRPQLGWVDFEFLRGSRALNALAERFTLPIWDNKGIARRIEAIADPRLQHSTHSMFDQLGKMLTVQGWLE